MLGRIARRLTAVRRSNPDDINANFLIQLIMIVDDSSPFDFKAEPIYCKQGNEDWDYKTRVKEFQQVMAEIKFNFPQKL